MRVPRLLAPPSLRALLLAHLIALARATAALGAPTPSPVPSAGVVVEAEDFAPRSPGWKAIKNGAGNYMVDVIGFNHISGERLLSGSADSRGAKAVATVAIPEPGAYRVWSRFETPTGMETRFRVEIRQRGRLVGAALMGEKDAPKRWFGETAPRAQYDAAWGSEGLAEQHFDVTGLRAGPAEITLIAVAQPAPAADRNVDFLFLTRDLTEGWRARYSANTLYPLLDAALERIPTRYHLRITSKAAAKISLGYRMSRNPWWRVGDQIDLAADTPGPWIPLRMQDVTHFTVLTVSAPAGSPLDLRAELSGGPAGTPLWRSIEWKDPLSNTLAISLPPYPGKYPDERISTVEEQYREILNWLAANPSQVGREPREPLAWAMGLPVAERGRVGDAAADLFFAIGLRGFGGFLQPPHLDRAVLDVFRERFAARGIAPNRGIALGQYRYPPSAEHVAAARKAAEEAGVLPWVQRLDYGDEINFSEWLRPFSDGDLKTRFAEWQRLRRGEARFPAPDSSAAAAARDPVLYVDSSEFYEATAIRSVADLAREIPKSLGPEVHFGANVSLHPFYYPEIAKTIKWFRGRAADFGRHSEYFWQVGQPGPLVNAYAADHFRAGMKDDPRALLLQYTMPHSPGNSDGSFRRSAFSHLAHGARGLDYFGVGINGSFTENYIDFRDPARFGAIRDVNRAMASIEDILPTSRVEPSKVALILSDSTERWDFAKVAVARAARAVYGDAAAKLDYHAIRLAYHQDRLGIYYALVHASRAPDLLIEGDVLRGDLKDYQVAYWVGDCADPRVVSALSRWVEKGGQLVATAGALRYDPYRKPLPEGAALLGLASARLDEQAVFFRPQIELPRLPPIDTVDGVPVFGVLDRTVPRADTAVLASFASGAPALLERGFGKGRIRYVAALPGVSYLWSALQPPRAPPRGPWSHASLDHWNAVAGAWITGPAKAAAATVEAERGLVDARVLRSPRGIAIPLANYSADPASPITLLLRFPGLRQVLSANRGELTIEPAGEGAARVTWEAGFGDILRIETGPAAGPRRD